MVLQLLLLGCLQLYLTHCVCWHRRRQLCGEFVEPDSSGGGGGRGGLDEGVIVGLVGGGLLLAAVVLSAAARYRCRQGADKCGTTKPRYAQLAMVEPGDE